MYSLACIYRGKAFAEGLGGGEEGGIVDQETTRESSAIPTLVFDPTPSERGAFSLPPANPPSRLRLLSLSRGCSDSRQFLLKHRTVDPAFSRPLGLSLGLIPLFVPRCYKPLQSMFSSHLSYSSYVLTASPLPSARFPSAAPPSLHPSRVASVIGIYLYISFYPCFSLYFFPNLGR